MKDDGARPKQGDGEALGTWHLVGAFDRFNFGDLLFPHLARRVLERLEVGVATRCWSTRAADLEHRGGVVCEPLPGLLGGEAELDPARDRVVVAGGEVLAARWSGALRALTGARRSLLLGVAERLSGRLADRFARSRLDGSTPQPWVLGPRDVGAAPVAYNAVGALGVSTLPPALAAAARSRLALASWLAVRDARSRRELETWGLEPRLAPDPAALVAELFPRDEIERRASPAVRELLAASGGGYLVFQCGRFALRGELEAAAESLAELLAVVDRPLLLLPLGLASAHEDPRALDEIARRLPAARRVPAETLWDQLATLAAAGLFAGTSLHGVLVATAFAVPAVGVGSRVAKLDAFLHDWHLGPVDEKPVEGCVEPHRLARAARRALDEPERHRRERASRLADAAWEHAREMVAALT